MVERPGPGYTIAVNAMSEGEPDTSSLHTTAHFCHHRQDYAMAV